MQDFLLQEEIERERERRALCVWPALGRGPGRQRGAWGEAVLRPDLGLSLSQASGSARSARRSASEERRSPKSQSEMFGFWSSAQGLSRATSEQLRALPECALLLRRAREREEREKERLKQREEKAGGKGALLRHFGRLCCGAGKNTVKGFLCYHNGVL